MGPDDDADDPPIGPPPPRAERPWRHPSELGERPPPSPRSSGSSGAGPRRPGLWVVITASALVGTVLAVVVVGLVRELQPTSSERGDAVAGPGPAPESTLVNDASAVHEGRTLGPTLPRGSPGDPWLGITGRDADGAVLVTDVDESGPAATAGVAPGDLIVAVQRQAIASMAELQAVIAALEPGAVLVLDVMRDRAQVSLMAVLGVRA